jgi:hypothetical protein
MHTNKFCPRLWKALWLEQIDWFPLISWWVLPGMRASQQKGNKGMCALCLFLPVRSCSSRAKYLLKEDFLLLRLLYQKCFERMSFETYLSRLCGLCLWGVPVMVSLRRDGKTSASDRRKLRAFGITSSFVTEESRCFGVLGWEYHSLPILTV